MYVFVHLFLYFDIPLHELSFCHDAFGVFLCLLGSTPQLSFTSLSIDRRVDSKIFVFNACLLTSLNS